MATTDRSLLDLGIKSSANDDDTLVSVVSNKASRLTLGYIKNLISQWNNLKNKPFDDISSDDFTISTDSLSGSTTLKLSPTISAIHTVTTIRDILIKSVKAMTVRFYMPTLQLAIGVL